MEDTMLLWDVEVVKMFNACRWLGYFLSLITFDEELATEFTSTSNKGKASI